MDKKFYKPLREAVILDRDKEHTAVRLNYDGFEIVNEHFTLHWSVPVDTTEMDKPYTLDYLMFLNAINNVKHTSSLILRNGHLLEYTKDGSLVSDQKVRSTRGNAITLPSNKPFYQSAPLSRSAVMNLKTHDAIRTDIELYPELNGIIIETDGSRITFSSTNGYALLQSVYNGLQDSTSQTDDCNYHYSMPQTYIRNVDFIKLFGKNGTDDMLFIALWQEDDHAIIRIGNEYDYILLRAEASELSFIMKESYKKLSDLSCSIDKKAMKKVAATLRGNGTRDDACISVQDGQALSNGEEMFAINLPDGVYNAYDIAEVMSEDACIYVSDKAIAIGNDIQKLAVRNA